jgi:hypothetical protein
MAITIHIWVNSKEELEDSAGKNDNVEKLVLLRHLWNFVGAIESAQSLSDGSR